MGRAGTSRTNNVHTEGLSRRTDNADNVCFHSATSTHSVGCSVVDLRHFDERETVMANEKFFDELGVKIRELLANSPARDIEKNVRATLAAGFARLDLITREEFDVQSELLARTREKLAHLEAKLAELEKRGKSDD